MHKFTTQGWKMDNGSPAGLHAIRSVPTLFIETPPGVASETSEELAERDEAPAPLPPRGMTPSHRSDVAESVSVVDGLVATTEDATLKNSPVVNNGGKGLYAKDKRKIREKRRSTGIAKFNASELQDGVTANNTSYNELISGHIGANLPSIVEPPSPEELDESHHKTLETHDDVKTNDLHERTSTDALAESASTGDLATVDTTVTHNQSMVQNGNLNGSDGSNITPVAVVPSLTNDLNAVSAGPVDCKTIEPSTTGYAKPCIKRPPVATKPGIAAKPATRNLGVAAAYSGSSQYAFNGLAKVKSGPSEVEVLTQQLRDLQMVLEAEKNSNSELKELLSERDARIYELTIEVMALNEDLDVADEDFEKLEEENKAILQAMSQLSSSATSASSS